MNTDWEKELRDIAEPEKAKILSRFFKTGQGEYGEGDRFIGITVPANRSVSKHYAFSPLEEIEEMLRSPIHEFRLAGLLGPRRPVGPLHTRTAPARQSRRRPSARNDPLPHPMDPAHRHRGDGDIDSLRTLRLDAPHSRTLSRPSARPHPESHRMDAARSRETLRRKNTHGFSRPQRGKDAAHHAPILHRAALSRTSQTLLKKYRTLITPSTWRTTYQ